MKIRNLLHLVVMVFLAVMLVACQTKTSEKSDTSLSDVQKNGKIVVATETGFAPFAFKTLVNGKDTVVGSDIDMVKQIAKELDVDVEIKEMSFDNVLVAVQSGKADMGVSGVSITKERQKQFDFSMGYYTAKTKLIIQKSDQSVITTVDDLKDQSVAAQKGSIQETVVTDQIPNAHLVSLPETGEMVMELKQGKVKALVLEEPIAKAYIENNPDLIIADIELSSTDSDTYGIIFPKGSHALVNAVDDILKPLVTSGEVDQMIQSAFELSVNK